VRALSAPPALSLPPSILRPSSRKSVNILPFINYNFSAVKETGLIVHWLVQRVEGEGRANCAGDCGESRTRGQSVSVPSTKRRLNCPYRE
jgi:hypothetical protein